MKNQYFGDRRDFFKFDLLLDLVECQRSRRLLFIPMLTPNDGSGEGRFVSYSSGSRRRFLFDFLRDAVALGRQDMDEHFDLAKAQLAAHVEERLLSQGGETPDGSENGYSVNRARPLMFPIVRDATAWNEPLRRCERAY